jgi:3-carboxy-cis,cis-muconate cycloisomerase
VAELGGWLSLVTGSLGKIGQDLILLGQSEVGEVTAGAGGGSSTMPHKANPVGAEALVTLARLNAGTVGTLHQALVAAQERDGIAMGLEWFALPSMCAAAGGATRLALGMVEALAAHAERIAATFAADRGLMLAEAAVFALAERMPRPEAQALVAEAVAAVDSGTLAEALAARVPEVDWAASLDPRRLTGDAPALADRLRAAMAEGRG